MIDYGMRPEDPEIQLDMKQALKSCKILEKQEGNCLYPEHARCGYYLGSSRYNRGRGCGRNGWAEAEEANDLDPVCAANARAFRIEHSK